jgi:hypothetical protein
MSPLLLRCVISGGDESRNRPRSYSWINGRIYDFQVRKLDSLSLMAMGRLRETIESIGL